VREEEDQKEEDFDRFDMEDLKPIRQKIHRQEEELEEEASAWPRGRQVSQTGRAGAAAEGEAAAQARTSGRRNNSEDAPPERRKRQVLIRMEVPTNGPSTTGGASIVGFASTTMAGQTVLARPVTRWVPPSRAEDGIEILGNRSHGGAPDHPAQGSAFSRNPGTSSPIWHQPLSLHATVPILEIIRVVLCGALLLSACHHRGRPGGAQLVTEADICHFGHLVVCGSALPPAVDEEGGVTGALADRAAEGEDREAVAWRSCVLHVDGKLRVWDKNRWAKPISLHALTRRCGSNARVALLAPVQLQVPIVPTDDTPAHVSTVWLIEIHGVDESGSRPSELLLTLAADSEKARDEWHSVLLKLYEKAGQLPARR